MYAEHRYTPSQGRGVSFAAAFAINGALIGGLLLAAPKIVETVAPTPLTIRNIPLPVPEPLPEPKPLPRAERTTPSQPLPHAPTPQVPSQSDNPIATTGEITPPLPPLQPPLPSGPIATPEPSALPLPKLVGASQDPRYLRDFQPAYPASELRAGRDGVVTLRVLIGIDGRVKAVEQLGATSSAFSDAARRQALAKWRFKPATRGGIPEESWKQLTVRFTITNP